MRRSEPPLLYVNVFIGWVALVLIAGPLATAQDAPRGAAAPAAPKKASPKKKEPAAASGRLQYGWKEGQTYQSSFNIEATIGDEERVTHGVSSYTAAKEAVPAIALQPIEGSGTAFVIAANGYLVSCAHVVEDATKIEVQLAKTKYPAEVVAADAELDLALLKIKAGGLTPLALVDSSKVELGQEVRSVGFPLSDVLGDSVKITRGTVAGKVELEGSKLVQIDASINPGNSGGPVVDAQGRVVGVASQKLLGEAVSNLGFCVPANEVRKWLAKHKITPAAAEDAAELSGPDLAKKVTPAVALVRVTVVPGTSGGQRYVLRGRGFLFPESENRLDDAFSIDLSVPESESDNGVVTVDSFGEIVDSGEGASLPYLLGPLTALTIEPLPKDGRKQWRVERIVQIFRQRQREQENNDPLARLHPRLRGRYRSPFDRFRQPETVTEISVIPAVETLEYELRGTTRQTATIGKKQRLSTKGKDADKDAEGLELTAEGELTFDRQEGVMRDLKLTGTFIASGTNVTIRVPLSVTFEPFKPPEQPVASRSREPRGGTRTPPSITPLPPAKKKPDPKVQLALEALAAKEPDRNARLQALKSLAAAKRDPDSRDVVVEALAGLLSTDDHELRALALKALTHWDWATRVGEVLPLLSHADADTRRAAIEYLGEMRDGAAAPDLAKRMSQAEERPQVAAALRLIGPAAEEAVLQLLTHKDADVRAEACRILAEIGGDESVAPLRKLAAREGDAAAVAAKEALRSLGHSVAPPAKKKPKPAVEDDNENPFDPSAEKKKPPAEEDNENPFEPSPKPKP